MRVAGLLIQGCINLPVWFFFICLAFPSPGSALKSVESDRLLIKDAAGRPVEILLPVKRVVTLNSDILEIIRALDATDLVVGVNNGIARDPLFWNEMKNRKKVGKWSDPNYESIAGLEPDLVIGYEQRPGPDMEKRLSPFGIAVMRLDFYKLSSLEKELETLGRVLGREIQARRLISWYRKRLAFIKEVLRHSGARPEVYVESYADFHATGPGSGAHEMCELAGGNNIAGDFFIPYTEVTSEWVLTKRPQVIIKAAITDNCYGMADKGKLRLIREKLMGRPVWEHIPAVRNKKVMVMASDIWTGPRAFIGAGYMAKCFYPHLFKGFDPAGLHREYIQVFQRVGFKGVYVCPCPG